MSHEQHFGNSIPISWISTDDLIDCRPELMEQIKALTQADVEYIAGKVGDALQETYGLAIKIVLDDFMNRAVEDQTNDERQK